MAQTEELIKDNKYIVWINERYHSKESSKNKCNKAVQDMVLKFPELTVQVGYANGVYHCWAKDEEGNIVDPTAKQFEGDISYSLVAGRFLRKSEIELSTGVIFLDKD